MAVDELVVGRKYKLGKFTGPINWHPAMEAYVGTIQTCISVDDDNAGRFSGTWVWWWPPSAIDEVATCMDEVEIGAWYTTKRFTCPIHIQRVDIVVLDGTQLRVRGQGWCKQVVLTNPERYSDFFPLIKCAPPKDDGEQAATEAPPTPPHYSELTPQEQEDLAMVVEQLAICDLPAPPLPFNPTYKRFCRHDWKVRESGVVSTGFQLDNLLLTISGSWLVLGGSVCCGLGFGLHSLAAFVSVWAPCFIFYLAAVAISPSSRVLSKRREDKICLKCGRIHLGLTKHRNAAAERAKAALTRQKAQDEANAAKRKAREELENAAMETLNRLIEMARKAL